MKDIKIKYSGTGENKTGTIHISGECTIYNVESIYNNLKDKIDNVVVNNVIVEKVSNIDLAGMQLLIALKKTLINNNNDVSFHFKINDELKNILTNCGFNDLLLN